jgi:acetolactate synthase-1/2/3 large subunit
MNEKNTEIKTPKTGGDLLVECLLQEKVKYLFGIPGGQLLPMYDAIYRWGKEKGIQTILVRHEQAAAHAADAYARLTGELGVCFGTVGPGVTDMVPGVGAAWSDNIPLLVIGAQIKRVLDGKSTLQGDLDQITLMKSVTKAQFQIQTPLEILKIIPRAIRTAFSGKMGPVYVDIREEAFYGEIPLDEKYEILSPEKYRPKISVAGDPKAIDKAIEMIENAKKPLIVCGGEVNSYNASEELKKLSEKYAIPAATSATGIGGISSDTSTHLGASVISDAVLGPANNADVVISVGCKWNYIMGLGLPPLWPKEQKLIQINIDPSEIGKNRPVDIGIIGDVKTVLTQIFDKLDGVIPENYFSEWNISQQELKENAIKKNLKKFNSEKVPIAPERFIKEILEFFPSDTIIILDGGDTSFFAGDQIDLYKPRPPRSTLASVGMGHLGNGIPFAVGAKFAYPEKHAVVIQGDGSFLFNVQELETAIRYNLPFIVVIANNSAWGMIKSGQKIFEGKRYIDVDIPNIDYAAIAKGFGCYAETVDKPGEIKPALQRAIESGKPAILDVKINWDTPKATKTLFNLGII